MLVDFNSAQCSYYREDYFDRQELYSRGWNSKLVNVYLYNYDIKIYLYKNRYKKFYSKKRVSIMELLDEFQLDKQYLNTDKEYGLTKYHMDKFKKVMYEYVEDISNRINFEPIIPDNELFITSFYHYNKKQQLNILKCKRKYIDIKVTDTFIKSTLNSREVQDNDETYEGFLKRVCVNYLKHNFNDYDLLVEESKLIPYYQLDTYKYLKNIILSQIAKHYPYLEKTTSRIMLESKYITYDGGVITNEENNNNQEQEQENEVDIE